MGRHHHHKSSSVSGMSLIAPAKLDFWLKKHYNVLFEGKHGVGKTSIITDAFKRNKLRWLCLSGATMDPFIDFVGVPVKVKDSHGEQIIDLLKPKYIKRANPQAIFIDEFNRAHKKVRNAVMELIQFKTINGQRISSDLQVVWTAINPDESGEYDVEKLDPAQRDRFQVQINIPYQCDRSYFTKRYGAKWADSAIEYWNNIPEEIRNKVSPRRLDYALQLIKDGGDARDVLPIDSNVSALLSAIKVGPVVGALDDLLKASSEEIYKFFSEDANFDRSLKQVNDNKKYMPLARFFPKEKLAAALMNHTTTKIKRFVMSNAMKLKEKSPFFSTLKEIVAANQNQRLTNQIQRYVFKVKTPSPAVRTKSGRQRGFPPGLTAVAIHQALNASPKGILEKDLMKHAANAHLGKPLTASKFKLRMRQLEAFYKTRKQSLICIAGVWRLQ